MTSYQPCSHKRGSPANQRSSQIDLISRHESSTVSHFSATSTTIIKSSVQSSIPKKQERKMTSKVIESWKLVTAIENYEDVAGKILFTK